MDEVLDVNLMEESFDDPAIDDEESEEDELAAAGMHVEGEDDDEVAPLEPETE